MKNLILTLSACGFLIAPPAVAAEMPVKAAPSSAPAPYNWTGFYAGLAGGLAWGHSQFIDADPTNLNGLLGSPLTKQFDVSGGVVGGTVSTGNSTIGLPASKGIFPGSTSRASATASRRLTLWAAMPLVSIGSEPDVCVWA